MKTKFLLLSLTLSLMLCTSCAKLQSLDSDEQYHHQLKKLQAEALEKAQYEEETSLTVATKL